jgi:hypothetical protein
VQLLGTILLSNREREREIEDEVKEGVLIDHEAKKTLY